MEAIKKRYSKQYTQWERQVTGQLEVWHTEPDYLRFLAHGWLQSCAAFLQSASSCLLLA
jgi:hypothetical protein